MKELEIIIINSEKIEEVKTFKKINNLMTKSNLSSNITPDNSVQRYLNLSDHTLSKDEIDFLNLGINYQIQPKYSKFFKEVEMEQLYENIIRLYEDGKLDIKNSLADHLRSEAKKHRNKPYPSILNKQHRKAAHELKNNPNIIIRKTDKDSKYVILNKLDYFNKCNHILHDNSKFMKIKKDTTNTIKKKVNNLIDSLNAKVNDIKMEKIIGDFQPGYFYGNVKTHKTNNPIRPIVSQVTTPTYKMAKSLNEIIKPYCPRNFAIKSTNEFIDIIKPNISKGIIASLDVNSLFTNVPINETIDIIMNYCYHNTEISPPKIPESLLREMLLLCTKETIFLSPEGELYKQTDGIAMGSPLGTSFADFYMGHLEETFLKDSNILPIVYCRYVDDIFILAKEEQHVIKIKETFENNSVLKFDIEWNQENKLPFLDVLIDNTDENLKLMVHRKPTNSNFCLHGKSECPIRYKESVISSYVRRAHKICSSPEDLETELSRIESLLINNQYNQNFVKQTIKQISNKISTNKPKQTINNEHTLYYANQMHANYKTDEKILKRIIHNNTRTHDGGKLNLIIYYKAKSTQNLVITNNMTSDNSKLKRTNVIYKYNCPLPHGQVVSYIGLTQNCLSRRLTLHLQQGSIKKHMEEHHKIKLTREMIVNNTQIIDTSNNRKTLAIKEALHILNTSPYINKQYDNFDNTLKLFTHRTITQKLNRPNNSNIDNKNNTFSENSIIYTTTQEPNNKINDTTDNQEIIFNENSIIHTSTQNSNNSNDTAELEQRIEQLLAPIRRSKRLKEKTNNNF